MLGWIAAAAILAPAPELPRLSVRGPQIVAPDGKPVPLRGVNFGGWLVEEIWMTPWEGPGVEDHVSLWRTVEQNLGREAMLRVRKAWRNHWITAEDFRRVRASGLNHVRIPFLFDLLEEPDGLRTLQNAVRMAKQAGLYVVLDLHGTPGRQSDEHHTGEKGKNRLWFEPKSIQKTVDIWKRLARTFRDEPTVAAFDLINEPMGAPNPAMLHLVHDRIVRGIRSVNPHTIIIFEDGYKGLETTPHLDLADWTHAVFSVHIYNFDAKATADHLAAQEAALPRLKELMGYRGAPLYIGEFNFEPHSSPQTTRDVVGLWSRQGWSWALWTWKTAKGDGPMGQWGLYANAGPIEPIRAATDTEAEMLRKIELTRTERLRAAPGVLDALAEAAR